MNAEMEEIVRVANLLVVKGWKQFCDCVHKAEMMDWLVLVLKDEFLLCNSCVGQLCQAIEVFIDWRRQVSEFCCVSFPL